jgi:hypothetical protein
MRALVGELLLEAWERAAGEAELLQPLILLDVSLPRAELERLRAMPVAERNLLLLRLHELSFGATVEAIGTCARCGAQYEFSVPVSKLTAIAQSGSAQAQVEWREDGRRYRLRQLNTDDLIASLQLADRRAAQDVLLSRCLSVSLAGPRAPSPAAVLEKFDELHAGAEVTCTIACPECGSEETVDLDIARFLWTEVRRAASRLLEEIHALATGYGWSERAILQLAEPRRRAYLELVGSSELVG